MLTCPGCRSERLRIRSATGAERIKAFVTGMRLYSCLNCSKDFRAVDRRKYQRVTNDDEVVLPAKELNRLRL